MPAKVGRDRMGTDVRLWGEAKSGEKDLLSRQNNLDYGISD